MALLAMATLMMCAPAFVMLAKEIQSASRPGLITVAVHCSDFLCFHEHCAQQTCMGQRFPICAMTQHPFRWLAVTSAVAPVLMAASMPFGQNRFSSASARSPSS